MSKNLSIKKLSSVSILGAIIAGGLAIESNAAPVIEAPSVPVPTRALVNPGFTLPGDNPQLTWYSLDGYIPGDESTLEGWFSTHPTTGYRGFGNSRFRNAGGNPFNRLVEIWGGGFLGVQAAEGNSFAELNAQADSALYQDILVFSNESIPWSASHRGRARADISDIAEVFISDPADWTGPTFAGDKLYSATISTSNNGSITGITPVTGSISDTSASTTSLANGWAKYSDTWTGPAFSKKYRFAFQAVSTGGGDNTVGNFLDNIQIKLSPVVDLVDPQIEEINPLTDSIYYLPVRVNGKSESEATIEIDISLEGNDFTNYFLGEDLFSGSDTEVLNGVTATKLENGNIQVTIPANLYDPNNPNDYILVPIDFADSALVRDQTATFEVVNVDGGGGDGVQDLLIPPSDTEFAIQLETEIKASRFPD